MTPWSGQTGTAYPKPKGSGPNGKLLAILILEIAIVFAWGFFLSLPLFGLLKLARRLESRSEAYKQSEDTKTDA